MLRKGKLLLEKRLHHERTNLETNTTFDDEVPLKSAFENRVNTCDCSIFLPDGQPLNRCKAIVIEPCDADDVNMMGLDEGSQLAFPHMSEVGCCSKVCRSAKP